MGKEGSALLLVALCDTILHLLESNCNIKHLILKEETFNDIAIPISSCQRKTNYIKATVNSPNFYQIIEVNSMVNLIFKFNKNLNLTFP